jgi:hypothetical protein
MKAGGRLTHKACTGLMAEFWLFSAPGGRAASGDDPNAIVNPEYGICLSSAPGGCAPGH